MPDARAENEARKWNEIWSTPQGTDWRAEVLAPVYDRILALTPRGSSVIDIGGGVGMLAERLRDDLACEVEVWEHNDAALMACALKGIPARRVDLEREAHAIVVGKPTSSVIVATEVLEHLTDRALGTLMRSFMAEANAPAPIGFFSVPNDRLSPEEEPQHAQRWTALAFKRFLQTFFVHVRVEVLGQPATVKKDFPSDRGQPSFLLGIVGMPKAQSVSMCTPARDEAADIERTLASFMGFADEIVVGIDPRTKDGTRAIAEKYADVVFELEELLGPPGEEVPEGGVHFAHIRNQCMARCTSAWIFMTEAHEPLWKGHDTLLHLDQVPAEADVLSVMRTGGRAPSRQQWLFPWICRNGKGFRYVRSTHNTLEYGDAVMMIVPQIRTLHERVHERDVARAAQRAVQNRTKLTEDWLTNQNEWSLHYLGAELREHDPEGAIERLHQYLEVGTSGALRYHTRLVLAKELVRAGRPLEARDVLHEATGDDWTRNEHWVFLGDLAFEREAFEEAATFFQYAATKRGAPLTSWWVDLAFYSWLPQQRLAMTYSALGQLEKALEHARTVLTDYHDTEAPEAFVLEAETNIQTIQEAIHGRISSLDQPAAAE